MTPRRLTPIALLALTLAACGDESSGEFRGACHFSALGSCTQWAETVPSALKSACLDGGAEWLSACPAENRLGTCAVADTGTVAAYTWVAYPGLLTTAADGEYNCDGMGGAWIAGPGVAGAAAPEAFSCDRRVSEGTCSDMSGTMAPENRTALEWICTVQDGGTLLAGTCPTANRSGTCTIQYSYFQSENRYYDAGAVDADAAACSGPARTWTPG